MEESNPELESFRQRWKEEVSARTKIEGKNTSNAGSSSSSCRPQPAPRLGTDRVMKPSEDEDETLHTQASHGFAGFSHGPNNGYEESFTSSSGSKEPQSAIEHYEKAVEKESQGSLGDSLNHYRKAFKVGS
jgi:F-box protein 9